MCLNIVGLVANSVGPDQTPQNAASDQGLHCLPVFTQVCLSECLEKIHCMLAASYGLLIA